MLILQIQRINPAKPRCDSRTLWCTDNMEKGLLEPGNTRASSAIMVTPSPEPRRTTALQTPRRTHSRTSTQLGRDSPLVLWCTLTMTTKTPYLSGTNLLSPRLVKSDSNCKVRLFSMENMISTRFFLRRFNSTNQPHQFLLLKKGNFKKCSLIKQ